MGLIRKIAEQRDRHILSHAHPHIAEGEVVLHWARVRRPGSRQSGFAYLTPERCVFSWVDRSEDDTVIRWPDVRSWGVANQSRGGPILAVETVSGAIAVQMPVGTAQTVSNVSVFLQRFEGLAPAPEQSLRNDDVGRFQARGDVELSKERRTLTARTVRIIKTVVGLVLVVGGLLIVPLPGPWSLPIVIAGLALLASEYDWAQDLLGWARTKYRHARDKLRSRRSPTD